MATPSVPPFSPRDVVQCINKDAQAYAFIGVVIKASSETVEWYHESGDRSVRTHLSRPVELHRIGDAKLARKDLFQ